MLCLATIKQYSQNIELVKGLDRFFYYFIYVTLFVMLSSFHTEVYGGMIIIMSLISIPIIYYENMTSKDNLANYVGAAFIPLIIFSAFISMPIEATEEIKVLFSALTILFGYSLFIFDTKDGKNDHLHLPYSLMINIALLFNYLMAYSYCDNSGINAHLFIASLAILLNIVHTLISKKKFEPELYSQPFKVTFLIVSIFAFFIKLGQNIMATDMLLMLYTAMLLGYFAVKERKLKIIYYILFVIYLFIAAL